MRQGTLTSDGYLLAEGPHLLEDARRAGCEIGGVLVSESAAKRMAVPAGSKVVTDKLMKELSATEATQGILALVRPPQHKLADMFQKNALAVILDGIQDPGNAGAILRAAEAFGSSGVVFLKGTVDAYNPKCIRASAGSMFRIPMTVGIDAAAIPAVTLYAASPRAAKTLDQVDLKLPCAFVIGSEGRGVSEDLLKRAVAVQIPTKGVESLNAAVAAGILLYEARRQRKAS